MAQAFQGNFTTGEVTELMAGKVDLAKYYNACALLENMLILPFGGVVKRGGTEFIAEAKHHDKGCRLVRFEYSTEQAYVLEFGDYYIRFYKDGGQIMDGGSPYEIASPYPEADLEELYLEVQSADVLYITHGDYEPRKLMRLGHTDWRLEKVFFDKPPVGTDYWKPNCTLTPSATTGTGVTFTVSSGNFLREDVNRFLNYGVPRARIATYISATQVAANILSDFPDTNPIPAGSWSMSGEGLAKARYQPGWLASGVYHYYAFEGDMFNFSTDPAADAWRSADVGKFFQVLGGMVRVDTYTNPQLIGVVVVRDLPQFFNVASYISIGKFTILSAIWGPNNYPRVCGLFQNRLLMAGSRDYPYTIWGSKMGNYEDFVVGSKYDEPFEFTISSGQANVIRWLAPLREIFVGTNNGEWRLSGGANGEPIAGGQPPLVSQESANGVFPLAPVTIGRTVVYADRFGVSLYQINYQLESDTFKSNDLTLMAPHILLPSIAGLAYAAKPHPIIWVPRTDGQLCSLTSMPEHEVMGWSRQITDGEVERVCTIPGTAETETWLLVKRSIEGATKRYIERLKSYDYGDDLQDAWFVDCGLQYSGAPATVISGLDHLEGKTVSVLADGLEQTDKVVSSGQITLDTAASQAQVGLGYTAKLQTLNLNLPTMNQQAVTKRVHEVAVRVYKSVGGKIGPDAANLESINPGSTAKFTGDKIVKYRAGWETDARVYLEHSDPTPLNVLALMPRFEQGEK